MKIEADSICPSCHKLGVYANEDRPRFWHCSNCSFMFGRDYKSDPTGQYIHLGTCNHIRKKAIAKIKRLQKQGEPPIYMTRGEKEAIKEILKRKADKISDDARLTPNYLTHEKSYPWRDWYWNFMRLKNLID